MSIKEFHLHLVSDSTGETVNSVSRAVIAQFDGIEPEEHIWSLVRTSGQLEKVIQGVTDNPGFVMYTVSDRVLRKKLKNACHKLNVPCVSVLSRVISDLSGFLGVKTTVHQPGRQYELDDEYFSRVEAINFALTHDDGQSTWDLEEADIVIVGVSRTSKSPTSVYLGYRGYRAANIPYVKGVPLPDILDDVTQPLIVGVTVSPSRLVEVRKNRLLSLDSNEHTNYVDIDRVEEEVKELKRLFAKKQWPVIDVTRRSVEEVAAAIIQMHSKHKEKSGNHDA